MASLKQSLMSSPQHNVDPLMELSPEKSMLEGRNDPDDSLLEMLSQKKMEAIL